MKYKVISALLVGLLAFGLYVTAASETMAAEIAVSGTAAAGETAVLDVQELALPLSQEVSAQADGSQIENTQAGAAQTENTQADAVQTENTQADAAQTENAQSGTAQGENAQADNSQPAVSQPVQQNEQESEYADLAIADVRKYVNIRSGPDTDSAIVGHIYNGAVAHVLETVQGEDGEWFRVVSGSVEGYMKSEFFLYGDAAAEVIDNYVDKYAVSLVNKLNIRKAPDLGAGKLGYLNKDEKLKLLENQGDWLKVEYTGESIGYISAEYAQVTEEFIYAKSMEEIEAEQARQRALEQRRREQEAAAAAAANAGAPAAEEPAAVPAPPSSDYASNDELRNAIVAYAMQFLGKPYIHGGRSLETGTDCSGFTSLIYAQFGYALSRTPEGQLSGVGRTVSYSEARPGDIICYGSRRCTHVALYIGNGQIIHAANPRKGVVTAGAEIDNILGVKSVVD